ncbi:hypothetical protein, partial [Saccharomonospora iraqiensis]|uniref:hypothetical protein n=1 Tax=Saccharomonospora iraqiensis TaxID=52698 RepID=UPI0018DE2A31
CLVHAVSAGVDQAEGRLRPALARLESAAAEAADDNPWLADHLRVEAARLSLADGRGELAIRELATLRRRDEPDAVLASAVAS